MLELALVYTDGRSGAYVRKPQGAMIRAMVRAGMNPEDAQRALDYMMDELREAATNK